MNSHSLTLRSEAGQKRTVLTKVHLRLMVEAHLLKPGELPDPERVATVVLRLIDRAIGFPQEGWHQWDNWAKGLE